jgi:hypothetical protein
MSCVYVDWIGIETIPFRSLGALVCIPPFIDYLFRIDLIFWFLHFGLFQVKVQITLICFGIVDFNIRKKKLDLIVMFCRLFS